MVLPKAVRLKLFVERLKASAPAMDREQARQLIENALNAIEDEFLGVPFDPANWRTDGRMYPVQDDNADDVEGYPDVTVYHSRKHDTFIRDNGAFEIREATTGKVVVARPGADGRGVWD